MSVSQKRKHALGLLFVLFALTADCVSKKGGKIDGFQVIEATIKDIHEAYRSGSLTCRELTAYYLERIAKYDKSTLLNAIVVVNAGALKTAEELDTEFQKTGKLRPLHGIPVVVKDNYETVDMQTTAGSIALKGFIPPDDAFQIHKLRKAGAVILAKSNMAEWAFSPYQTLSSTSGVTSNPYDLSRVPAGSSGGTAAAVAANFAAVGLGTDTGNSIRGPSSHCCLVGIRPTMGLTSRDGIIPLYLRNDVGGPMCRTVTDAVLILEVISGYDPNDPATEYGEGKAVESYTPYLDKDGLRNARLGVFRLFTQTPTADPEVLSLFEKAVLDMRSAGAEIVDPFHIANFGRLTKGIWCDTFRHDLNNYLDSLGDRAPVKNLLEVYNKGLFATPSRMRIFHALEVPPQEEPVCRNIFTEPKNVTFREAVLRAMSEQNVDFIIYPTWNNPPRKLNDFKSPPGDNSQLIPPHTGMPAASIPMGFTKDGLPAGIQIVGRLFEEPELIRVAYAYEQATQHRRPPEKFD